MRHFNRITLQTPESVRLEFILAGIGNRALALLIDYTILGLVITLLVVLWSIFSYQLLQYLIRLGINSAGLSNWLIAIPLLLSFAIFVGYFVFFETMWQGQTPGKRFAKIRVIQDNGRPVGLSQATLRAILRPIDDAFWLGTFFIMGGRKEKRVGDWAAGTVVVQEERPIATTDFSLDPQAQNIAQQMLQAADLSLLLPDDFAVVREYLRRRSKMNRKAREETANRLAIDIKAILKIEQTFTDISPDILLEATYLAYQQQSGNYLP
jgi:uncharacterized RDD family membrane protein YckC